MRLGLRGVKTNQAMKIPARSQLACLIEDGPNGMQDSIGECVILYQSGDASTWATTAVWGFEYNATLAARDAAMGGDVLFNSGDNSTIYRTYAQWFAIAASNLDFFWLGIGGIAFYNIEQSASSERIRRYLKSDPLKSDVLLPFFWDMSNPQVGIKGPDPEWSYAGALPDGNGGVDNSGDPVVHDEGVWCGSGYATLTNNVVIAGNGVTAVTVDGITTVTEDAEYINHFVTCVGVNTTVVGTTYTFAIEIQRVGRQYIQLTPQSGAFGTQYANFDLINGTVEAIVGAVSAGIQDMGGGWYRCSIVATATAAMTTSLLMICGIAASDSTRAPYCGGVGAISFTCRNSMGVASPYLFPYIPPATSVVSAAASTGGNGINVPMDAAMLAALSGGCTVAALVAMGSGSDEVPDGTNIGILTCNDSVQNILNSRVVVQSTEIATRSFDGTTYLGPYPTPWVRGEVHLKAVQVNAVGDKYRVGTLVVGADNEIQWSSWLAFDGSFDPLEYLRFMFDNTVPMWMRQVQLWSTGEVADTEILRLVERYGHA